MISEIKINLIEIHWENNDSGFDNLIYQVYGDSQKYGKNVLLQICKKQNIENIKSYLESMGDGITNIHFKAGSIHSGMWGKDPYELELCLAIMQDVINPPYNIPCNDNIPEDIRNKSFLVVNHGESGTLPKDITNFKLK